LPKIPAVFGYCSDQPIGAALRMQKVLRSVERGNASPTKEEKMRRLLGTALTVLVLIAGSAWAQDYPDRPVTWIVGQTPGGTTDTLARIFAAAMSKEFGQEIIVENRPGAGSTVGMQVVAEAEPDGYTLAVPSQSAFAISPLVIPTVAYDPLEDFAAVYNFAAVPLGLVVNAELGPKTLDELVALAKEKSGELNYSSGGTGTGSHFAGASFVTYAGISGDVVHIPYQGGSQASVAAASGETQFYVGPLAGNMMGVIDAKEVIPLAVSGNKRVAALPDVPTFAEAGLPEYKLVSWYGLAAPAGTPKEIVDKLNATANAVAQTPEVIGALAAQGIEPIQNTPEEFTEQIKGDVASFKKLVDDGVVKLK
jgi:tripartite-type tricarboxylate transporter receptor subunit TctC